MRIRVYKTLNLWKRNPKINMEGKDKRLARFGIIADVQYADIPDGYNYRKTKKRYYRSALDRLKNAADHFKSDSDVEFVLQLGDLIDGFATRHKNGSQKALDRTLHELDQIGKPVYHVLGNHEFYNFSREYVLKSPLNSAVFPNVVSPDLKETLYYHFSPRPGFRIVMLDSYDVAMIGRSPTDPEYQKAEKIIKEFNKNEELNSPEGLVGLERRFLKFNGGMSEKQLKWLDDTLTQADQNGELVLVSTHIPADIIVSDDMCLLWNYEEVQEVLHKHKCVKLFFAGHTHSEAYGRDDHGIHHFVWPSILETKPGSDAFATVNIYKNRLEIEGHGVVMSDCIDLM